MTCVDDDDRNGAVAGPERVAPVTALIADAALQPTLSHFDISDIDAERPQVLGALVDAALARPLRELTIKYCSPPAPAPLARLLRGGTLASLTLVSTDMSDMQFSEAGAALVAEALRATSALTALDFFDVGLFRRENGIGGILLAALVGHPSLRSLVVSEEYGKPVVMGTAFAALVAADAPALEVLEATHIRLGDAGLALLVDALPRNRHLRALDISANDMSEQFARERLLPAVRANTGLLELWAVSRYEPPYPAQLEAAELVRSRR